MADVNFFEDFERIWGNTGDVEAIDQNQYDQGWAFIGAAPPSVEQFNKVQQVTDQKVAWLFAQMKELADQEGVSLTAGMVDALMMSVGRNVQGAAPVYAADTGGANAYVVGYTPAVVALKDGMALWFKAKTANTGAATLNVNGLGAKPLVGYAHGALQGGEIVANGRCQVVWRADADAWVLTICSGGAVPVAAATKSGQAVSLGQFPSLFNTSGYQKLPTGWIIQWGSITTSLSADVSFTFPVQFPTALRNAVAVYANAAGSNAVVAALGAFSSTAIGVGAYTSNTGARIGAQINVIVLGH